VLLYIYYNLNLWANRCIYCGAVDTEYGALSQLYVDKHVVLVRADVDLAVDLADEYEVFAGTCTL
jgi:hypothetical protein